MDVIIKATFGNAQTITLEPAKCTINKAACNENLQHVEDSVSADLIYDPLLFSLLVTQEEFEAVVCDRQGNTLFTGNVTADVSWTELGDPYPIENIPITIRDNTEKLNKVCEAEIVLLNTTIFDVITKMCGDCNLLVSGTIPDIAIPLFILRSGKQYLPAMDAFCYQNGLSFSFNNFGRVSLFKFSTIPDTFPLFDESDIISGAQIKKSSKKYTGVKVGYNPLVTCNNEQVYFQGGSYGSNNAPVPIIIQPGVYWPFDAAPITEETEGKVYQSFESGYSETIKKYNGELSYRRSKATTLLHTYNHRIVNDWKGTLTLDRTEFESLKSAVRFRNTGSVDALLSQFAIRAEAIYLASDASVSTDSGKKGTLFSVECEYLHTSEKALSLAKVLHQYVTLGNFSATITAERAIMPGTFYHIDTGLSGFNGNFLILSYSFDCETNFFVYKCITIGTAAVNIIRSKKIFPEWEKANDKIISDLQTAVDLVNNGDVSYVPDNVTELTAIAHQDYIDISWPWSGQGLKNNIKRFSIEISRDNRTNWTVLSSTANSYRYKFDRTIDGYPEKADLVKYFIRVKAENIHGQKSALYGPEENGQPIDYSLYGFWKPQVPVVAPYCNNREVVLNWNSGKQYGKAGYEIQICKKDSIPIEDDWRKPATNLDERASEENYTDGTTGSYFISIEQFSQSLPLKDQAAGSPKDTKYYYRVRGVTAMPTTATPSATQVGNWTDPFMVLARPTGLSDLMQGSVGPDQLQLGAVKAKHLNVERLAAISSRLGTIRGDDPRKYKLVMAATPGYADPDDPDPSAPEGTFLLGADGSDPNVPAEESYLRRWFTPGVGWQMAMRLARLFIDAVSSKIIGNFQVFQSAKDVKDNKKPVFDVKTDEKIIDINGVVNIGNSTESPYRLNIRESLGIGAVTFTGTGLNDLVITKEGTISGEFEIKITNAETMSDRVRVLLPTASSDGLKYFSNVVFCRGKYWIGDGAGYIYTSPDAKAWTKLSFKLPEYINYLASSGTILIADCGGQQLFSHILNQDGLTWYSCQVPSAPRFPTCLTFANDKFLLCGENKKLLWKPNTDALDWQVLCDLPVQLSCITYGNGIYVGSARNQSATALYTSTDLITWTKIPLITNDILSICFGNGIFVAAGQSGSIYKSQNGLQWEFVAPPPGMSTVYECAFGNGTFVFGDRNDILYATKNLNEWYIHGTLNGHCTSLSFTNDSLVITTGDTWRGVTACVVAPLGISQEISWREINSAWSTPVAIKSNQARMAIGNYGIEIAYYNITGHKLNDLWSFSQGSLGSICLYDSDGNAYLTAMNGEVKMKTKEYVKSVVFLKMNWVYLAEMGVFRNSQEVLGITRESSPVVMPVIGYILSAPCFDNIAQSKYILPLVDVSPDCIYIYSMKPLEINLLTLVTWR